MILHKQAALQVLEAVRSNPSLTAAQGAALVDAIFKGKGSTYLGWYGEWWYKCGVTDAATWAGLRTRVTGMGEEHFQLAKNKMARLVAELAVIRIQKLARQAELAELEARIAAYVPAEETTQEILNHWNTTGPKVCEHDALVSMKCMVEQQIGELED